MKNIFRNLKNKNKHKTVSFRLVCIFFIVLFFSTSNVESVEITEHHIKAAFLYNLYRFITWPDRAPANSEKPVQYCALGTDKVDQLLEATIDGKNAKKIAITFKRIATTREINGCEILIVSKTNDISLQEVLTAVKGKAILTASNKTAFSKNGGMITLSQKNKRIHVIINIDAVKESKLKISSKVKRLSKIISNK